ncbi:hypothetical protein [Pontivivens insulae]|uniref:Lipoprotein n=1 Tax=Pontivivens insulae TaxID=1639689 RepID=A0A2R8ABB3_9RHOB|nr:hypothetical protein [Pontivivens insulae]RED11293.1 hypothetical protein DFR53_3328 [Pontivivens insulae]SPF29534.1 hypothetical protein POI8812_01845 [Pontivivens insulae]
MKTLRPLALVAVLAIAACGRDEPEVAAPPPPPETIQVAQVVSVEVAPARRGVMVIARALDTRGIIEELNFVPRNVNGGVLEYDLMGGFADARADEDMPAQRMQAALILSQRELRGARGIRINGAQTSAEYLFNLGDGS